MFLPFFCLFIYLLLFLVLLDSDGSGGGGSLLAARAGATASGDDDGAGRPPGDHVDKREDAEDNQEDREDKVVDSSDDKVDADVVVSAVEFVEWDDEKDAHKDEEHSLADPRHVEAHERLKPRRHEDFNDNNVCTDDPMNIYINE